MTVQEVFDKAWREYWDKPRFKESGWSLEVLRLYERHIADEFGGTELPDVDVESVRKWHRAMASTPFAANRALEVFSRIFSFAIENAILPPNGANVCNLVKAFPERKRSRYATPEELRKIGALLVKYGERYPSQTAFLHLLILTGARPRSIARARWNQLQSIGPIGLLTFHGKSTEVTGYEETVVVSVEAMDVIARLPKRSVFIVGEVSYRHLWDLIREEAGCPDLRVRDLRRTYASIGLSDGVGKDQIGRLLNHHCSSTTDRYAMLLPHARIAAAGQISKRIGGILNG